MIRDKRLPTLTDDDLRPRRLGALFASVLIVVFIGLIALAGQDASATEVAIAFPADCKQLATPVDCLYY